MSYKHVDMRWGVKCFSGEFRSSSLVDLHRYNECADRVGKRQNDQVNFGIFIDDTLSMYFSQQGKNIMFIVHKNTHTITIVFLLITQISEVNLENY